MTKNKRILSFIAALLVSASVFTACGGKSPESEPVMTPTLSTQAPTTRNRRI